MSASGVKLLAGLFLAAVIGGGVLVWQVTAGRGPAPGGPFQLTDHTGKAVTEADYAGHPVLLYFGYTFCADVCPGELQTIAQALDKLGPVGTDIQPLFVSIDPDRDTPEHLAGYVSLFHPRLVGLTGTPAQVAAVARAYRVYYARAAGSDDKAYTVDHSSFTYLLAADGRFLALFARAMSPDKLATEVRRKLQR